MTRLNVYYEHQQQVIICRQGGSFPHEKAETVSFVQVDLKAEGILFSSFQSTFILLQCSNKIRIDVFGFRSIGLVLRG